MAGRGTEHPHRIALMRARRAQPGRPSRSSLARGLCGRRRAGRRPMPQADAECVASVCVPEHAACIMCRSPHA